MLLVNFSLTKYSSQPVTYEYRKKIMIIRVYITHSYATYFLTLRIRMRFMSIFLTHMWGQKKKKIMFDKNKKFQL